MNYFKILLFLICLFYSPCFTQVVYNHITCEIEGEIPPPGDQITSYNLTGSLNAMVIIIGFPDLSSTWPILDDPTYPWLGQFPDGTKLKDYIIDNGYATVEEWYGASFERMYNVHSSGKVSASINFPKDNNGDPYVTDHPFSYWVTKNSGSDTSVCYNYWYEMAYEVANKIIFDDPNAFNNVNMVLIAFTGILDHQFHPEINGRAFTTAQTFVDPENSSNLFPHFNGAVSINRKLEALEHESLHNFGLALGSPGNFIGLPDRGYDEIREYPSHFNAVLGYDIM